MLYNDFIKEVFALSQIDLSAYKENQMKRRINSLMLKHSTSDYYSYLKMLKDDKQIYNEFIDYITINVSEFFRNPQQWITLEKDIIPIINKKSSIKIWSAACSNGEEPYSIAMLLRKYMNPNRFHIIATDIDENALNKMRCGVYNYKSLENLPQEYLKYFDIKDNEYTIKEQIKQNISIYKHNLLMDKYFDNIDLLLCRNVIIYFTEEIKDIVFSKLSNSLSESGILFLGSTEQIFNPERFGLKQIKPFFYSKYKKQVE